MSMIDSDIAELAYSMALEAVAMGASRDETRAAMIDAYPSMSPNAIADEMADAYRDALRQGIEREDIDPSWYA